MKNCQLEKSHVDEFAKKHKAARKVNYQSDLQR